MQLVSAPPVAGFRHEALFYTGEDGFMASVLPVVREALALDAPILIAVDADRIARLKAALGPDAERVQFAPMGELGRNPGRIIPAWHAFVDEHAQSGRPLLGIGEPVWPGRSDEELVECHRHEALLNLAFADAGDFRLLCPYDVTTLGADVLLDAQETHPRLLDAAGGACTSTCFAGLAQIAAPFDAELSPPPVFAECIAFETGTLGLVRRNVARRAAAAGLDPTRREDLVLAVNEVATNSVRHADGHGILRIWRDRAALVCEIRDGGLIAEPLAGRGPLAADRIGGFGLRLVHQLCDLVEVRSGAGGSVVRLRMQGGGPGGAVVTPPV